MENITYDIDMERPKIQPMEPVELPNHFSDEPHVVKTTHFRSKHRLGEGFLRDVSLKNYGLDENSEWELEMVPIDKIFVPSLSGIDAYPVEERSGDQYTRDETDWSADSGGRSVYQGLEESLAEGKYVNPIILIAEEQGGYILEDGSHRASIAKYLGHTHIPAYVYKGYLERMQELNNEQELDR